MLFGRKPHEFCKAASIATRNPSLPDSKPRLIGDLPCWREGCKKSPVGFFNVKPFCAEHFLYVCYQKLDSIVSDLGSSSLKEKKRLRLQVELGQIADQVYVVSLWGESLTRFEQIKLLDILDNASTNLSRLSRNAQPRRSFDSPTLQGSGRGSFAPALRLHESA